MPINQKHTDPTYLRTIVDGLNSGALQKDNPSSLPQGLVGVYEEAIPPASQVTERKKFLDFFGVWALMKKEVSAEFVVSMLDGWKEADVLDFIGRYSKWFNSPVSGVYTLYHERFRTFVLQKITESDILSVNDRVIKLCKEKLILKQGDEYERYALEHLSSHVLLAAMHSKEAGEELKKLAYDSTLWNRQIKVSNRFDWSKKMLDEMFQWALKYDESQILECSLCKVDLHYIEQNDAPQIIAMVANGEIENALARIESFGGTDKDGIERKFILYMICLMELTLLGSKEKPFRKSGIEQLLSHLDEHLPNDDSILNWNDFFSSFLMFQMACEWADCGFDFIHVFKRTRDFDNTWILERAPFTSFQFNVLIDCSFAISDNVAKISNLRKISSVLRLQENIKESNQVLQKAQDLAVGLRDANNRSVALMMVSNDLLQLGRLEEAKAVIRDALDSARRISIQRSKFSTLKDISSELCKLGSEIDATVVILEALSCARVLREGKVKAEALCKVSSDLFKLGRTEEAAQALSEAKNCAHFMPDGIFKSIVFSNISTELARQELAEEALNCARSLNDEIRKCRVLRDISLELDRQDKKVEASSLLEEAVACAQHIGDAGQRSNAFCDLFMALCAQGQEAEAETLMQESLACARLIDLEIGKCNALNYLSNKLYDRNLKEESLSVLHEALHIAYQISDADDRCGTLLIISKRLFVMNKLDESDLVLNGALDSAHAIDDESKKGEVIQKIAAAWVEMGDIEAASAALNEVLVCIRNMPNEYLRQIRLKDISLELIKLGRIDQAEHVLREVLNCALGVSDDYWKSIVLKELSLELFSLGNIEKALAIAHGISLIEIQSSVFSELAGRLANNGKFEEAKYCERNISDDDRKCSALLIISKFLFEKECEEDALCLISEAISCANSIRNSRKKCHQLQDIALELHKNDHLLDAKSLLLEALSCARGIKSMRDRQDVLRKISSALILLGLIDVGIEVLKEAHNCASLISQGPFRENPLKIISVEMAKQGYMKDALDCADDINDERVRSAALCNIYDELSKLRHKDAITPIFNASLDCARGIKDELQKCHALKHISSMLVGLNRTEEAASLLTEALAFSRTNRNESHKITSFKEISSGLSKIGHLELGISVMQEAVDCARGISDERLRSKELRGIAVEFSRRNQMESALSLLEESFEYAKEISVEVDRGNALSEVSAEFARMGKWHLAENAGLEIVRMAERLACWKNWTSFTEDNQQWERVLENSKELTSIEARLYYLQSWVESVGIVDDNCMRHALPLLLRDSFGSELLLQKHAVHVVTTGSPSIELVSRLNRTLNIQWALDIVAQFPKPEASTRLSTNLDTWLHEITDEDDREQIELWARQVAMGKITEEEFRGKIMGMN